MKSLPLLSLFLLISLHFKAQNADTVPPVLVCQPTFLKDLNDLNCAAQVFASECIVHLADNSSDSLSLGVRVRCSGAGFPENSPFAWGILEQATALEVWARDQAGNTSTCYTGVVVVSQYVFCDPFISLSSETSNQAGIDSTFFHALVTHCTGDTFVRDYRSNSFGSYNSFGVLKTVGYDLVVTASKNINPLNGITTNDLNLIQKHILGIEALNSPYKLVAADANLDGKVTMTDIVLLRKLLLGIYQELPHGKSWRFIPEGFVFSNPMNPFVPPFPESIHSPASELDFSNSCYFIGVKIGDVNFSADPDH